MPDKRTTRREKHQPHVGRSKCLKLAEWSLHKKEKTGEDGGHSYFEACDKQYPKECLRDSSCPRKRYCRRTRKERRHRARVLHEMSEISPGYILCSIWPPQAKTISHSG